MLQGQPVFTGRLAPLVTSVSVAQTVKTGHPQSRAFWAGVMILDLHMLLGFLFVCFVLGS